MDSNLESCVNGGRQTDREVREALHRRVLLEHRRDGNTLVLNELGLRHGICRADIAVVNGLLHGFEIKSDSDTLDRLPQQVSVYSEVFDKVTLVVGDRHTSRAIEMIPYWWGVKIAITHNAKVEFIHERKPTLNPEHNPIAIAELLWRPEVIEILRGLGIADRSLRMPRKQLYALLTEVVELSELRRLTRITLKNRTTWRGQRPPLSGDD